MSTTCVQLGSTKNSIGYLGFGEIRNFIDDNKKVTKITDFIFKKKGDKLCMIVDFKKNNIIFKNNKKNIHEFKSKNLTVDKKDPWYFAVCSYELCNIKIK
jgi:hypothetical protein